MSQFYKDEILSGNINFTLKNTVSSLTDVELDVYYVSMNLSIGIFQGLHYIHMYTGEYKWIG